MQFLFKIAGYTWYIGKIFKTLILDHIFNEVSLNKMQWTFSTKSKNLLNTCKLTYICLLDFPSLSFGQVHFLF